MGLFSSSEEKKRKNQEKQQRELLKFMQKYNLESIEELDMEIIKNISTSLAGSGLMNFGAMLSNDVHGQTKVLTQYLQCVFEQNWLIINQNDRKNKKLDKIIELFESEK